MERRTFIGLIGGGTIASASLSVFAQRAAKVWRIGVLETVPMDMNLANVAAFRQGLRELGYVESRDFVIEYRSADGHGERFAQLRLNSSI